MEYREWCESFSNFVYPLLMLWMTTSDTLFNSYLSSPFTNTYLSNNMICSKIDFDAHAFDNLYKCARAL